MHELYRMCDKPQVTIDENMQIKTKRSNTAEQKRLDILKREFLHFFFSFFVTKTTTGNSKP